MWCRHCQQEVPGIVSDQSGEYCCPRCGGALGERMRHWRPKASALAPQAASLAVVQPGESSCHPSVIPLPQVGFPPVLDDWEADEQLRHIGRALAAEELEAARPEILRIDAAHSGGIARAHRASSGQSPPARW